MNALGQLLRYALPVAYGALLASGPVWFPLTFRPVVGSGLVWLALYCAGLMWRPRLWVIAFGILVIRVAIWRGAVDWTMWIEFTATIQMVVPMLLIGVTSAYRRLPSPVPVAPGTIVPNADGIGALLALPVLLGLMLTGRHTALFVLAVGFAAYRAFEYHRKRQLVTRGRGWLAFLVGAGVVTAYALYWAWPDRTVAWVLIPPGAVAFGINCWAGQRAIAPWRNPSTVP